MKNKLKILLFTLLFINAIKAQEKFGNTLNLGVGVGYYAYSPAVSLNYEFDVFKNFTLAPFVSLLTYRNYYYWGDSHYPYRNYYYRTTIIPIGVKGTYYFDELLKAGDKWDFYLGASLGFSYRSTTWENGYYGEKTISQYYSPLYATVHIGTEVHLNQKVGLFLDLSNSLSTFGLSIHL